MLHHLPNRPNYFTLLGASGNQPPSPNRQRKWANIEKIQTEAI